MAQTGIHAADPQRSPAVAEQHAHRTALKSFRQAEGKKTHTIEPGHAIITADPHVAIVRLGQRPDVILRQPLLPLPQPEGKALFTVFRSQTLVHSHSMAGDKIVE